MQAEKSKLRNKSAVQGHPVRESRTKLRRTGPEEDRREVEEAQRKRRGSNSKVASDNLNLETKMG